LKLLLQRFPLGVSIPPAVWREVVEDGLGEPGAADVAAATWLNVIQVKDQVLVSLLQGDLDEGEAEAVALGRQESAAVLLLDEKKARQVAQQMGMKILGTVGILVWAKHNGLIANLRQQLDAAPAN
jgi:hypothetical protein